MSEESGRSRTSVAMRDELADINQKLDTLIRYWADAAEFAKLMDECRETMTVAFRTNRESLETLNNQLALSLTPVSSEPPSRRRVLLVSGLGLAALGVSFWLGTMTPVGSTRVARVQRVNSFVADVHTTLERSYTMLPAYVQSQLQRVYEQHHYEPLRTPPQEKK